MPELQPMYAPATLSRTTELSGAITAAITTIGLTSVADLPDGPNVIVIYPSTGPDESAETVLYTAKSGNTLTGCERGYNGTTAKSWPSGTRAARLMTAQDLASLQENVRILNDQNKEASTLTHTIKQGQTIIEADQASPAGVVVLGQTRYNLLGNLGNSDNVTNTYGMTKSTEFAVVGTQSLMNVATASGNIVYRWILEGVLKVGQTYLAIIPYRSVGSGLWRFRRNNTTVNIPENDSSGVFIHKFVYELGELQLLSGATGSTFWMDAFAFYETTPQEHALINVDPEWSGDKLAARYPYIDGMQSVRGVLVSVKGRNLLPPFGAWTLSAGVQQTEPYKAIIAAGSSGNQTNRITLPVVPNRTYTLDRGDGDNRTSVVGGGVATLLSATSEKVRTFNTGIHNEITVTFDKQSTVTDQVNMINPMLVLGDVSALPPSFVPQEDQRHIADVTLPSLPNGIRDIYDATKGEVWRALGQTTLGELTFNSISTALTNVDRIRYTKPQDMDTSTVPTRGELVTIEGMSYQPGPADSASNIGTFSTHQSPNIIDFFVAKGTTRQQFESSANMSAKVIYRLAAPGWEPVPHSGALTVHPGSNIVEIATGRVLREKVVPVYDAANRLYWINNLVPPTAPFAQRPDQIIGIYREAQQDSGWTIGRRGTPNATYGYPNASIREADYDATKDYYVSYSVLDRHTYTTAVSEAMIAYGANIGSVLGWVVEQLARVMTHLDTVDFALDYIQAHTDNNTVDIATMGGRVTAQESLSANRNGYGVTAGSATAYTLTLSPVPVLSAGLRVTVQLHADNGATPTINVNGLGARPIRRPNGSAPPAGLLKNGGIYSLVYDGSAAFILTGEGGEYGDAAAGDVLAGKTIGTEDGLVNGTIVNRTGIVAGQSGTSSGTSIQIRPQPGFYPGDTGNRVTISDPTFQAANIRAGMTIFGLTGTLIAGKRTATGTITSSSASQQFYPVGGGTMNRGVVNLTGLAFTPGTIVLSRGDMDELVIYSVYFPHIFVGGRNYTSFVYTTASPGFVRSSGRIQVPAHENITFSYIVYEE
ncbi:hypothetical protein [Paenibacillus daejeonensis]|uniref:hypothetical protein n=1 Tax=Paenibacillus daejeonensis TaxID=135193 RepID=UPI00037A07BB|nr:hypothetical protein [Paenibacillus daejeonensis]